MQAVSHFLTYFKGQSHRQYMLQLPLLAPLGGAAAILVVPVLVRLIPPPPLPPAVEEVVKTTYIFFLTYTK